MRRTITTQNHFITCIPSWRVKAAGVFCFFVLFLLSCKDELSYIGFHKEPRISTYYIEIPVNPSVIQMTGLLTENDLNTIGPRILVGRYNDPQFGIMNVHGYSNYAPPLIALTPSATATADSLVLQLTFDFYRYGSASTSNQRLQVFEVLDTIHSSFVYIAGADTIRRTDNYFNSSTIAVSPQVIGDVTFNVDPVYFDESFPLNQDRDTTNNRIFKVRIKITSPTLANDLLNDMISNPDLLKNFSKFSGKYKGFAFIMNQGDQIIGINPAFRTPLSTSKDTKLSLYYTDGGIKTKADFLFNHTTNASTGQLNPVTSFTTLSTDYASTTMSGIQPYKDIIPFGNYLYVQSATALVTKFDLTNFYQYIDTIENAVFNSAELVVNNTSTRPPYQAQFRVLDQNNFFRSPYIDSLVNGVITKAPDPYFQIMGSVLTYGLPSSPTIDINADLGVTFPIFRDTYSIPQLFITNFCQAMYTNRHYPQRVKTFCLMPTPNEFKKSINTFVLDKSAFLRIYYSKPVIKVR